MSDNRTRRMVARQVRERLIREREEALRERDDARTEGQ
mgnify:CR=1 FL=1